MNQSIISIKNFKGIINADEAIRASDNDHSILTQARNVVIDDSWMIMTDNNLNNMTKLYSSASIMGVPSISHGGCTLTAESNLLKFTDAFSDTASHPEHNFIPFDSDIRMMISVEDGIWVSDIDNIYFLNGLDMSSITMTKIANFGIIKGSVVECRGNDIKDKFEITGKAILALTSEGICLMAREGNFRNLTQGRYNIPTGIYNVTASFDKYNTANLYTITIT